MNSNKSNLSKDQIDAVKLSIKQKKYDRALELLNTISNKESNLDLVNRIRASVYLYKKDWEKSLLYYQKIDNKNNFNISNNMGVAFYKLGKFVEASAMFKEAISFNNKYIPAYENLSLTQKLLGNYELSINCILQGLKLMPNNNKIKNYLIDILNYFEPLNEENYIINIDKKIRKLDSLNKKKLINDETIKDILNQSEKILKESNVNFNFNETQIFRRNKIDLNCKRHLDIFTTHKIIPKFCFSCFKVQITLDNILDLIKLYFYFNNVNLKNNNIRKCVVELRKKVDGNYKGYIFSDSLQDAKEIEKKLNNELQNEKIYLNKIEIKRGCTEYYDEFELYKDINQNVYNIIYKEDWTDIEKRFDEKHFISKINDEKVYNNTLNKFNLTDFLIIKNWLLYAKIIDDDSYKKIIKFDINDKNFDQLQKEQIKLRKKH
ncbi:hypothetical protein OAR24_00280 [Candidatus Pelagibacter sp.]|nr:hypothetical protein [Candidatus Pelagibacter sp.]